jgi:hypothetical protein
LKFIASIIALAVVAFASVSIASAAGPNGPPSTAPGKNPLTCFADPPATCTSNGKTATFSTASGGVAGVYLAGYNSSFYGVRTNLVTKLSNTVSGSTLGIDPRWSIPIDVGPLHDGYTDYFVYVSFANCNNGAGLVDVINDPTCTIDMGDGSNTSYPNWAAFVTANPNTYIALNDYYAFVIADGSGAPGTWTVSNVQVGKPGK